MPEQDYRIEVDSLGEVRVPADAMYGAQTQRAVENFPISGRTFPRSFVRALGLIKYAAAQTNEGLGLLDSERAAAIREAAQEVIDGKWDEHFPIDIYQTGSGTSTNMNANEVISNLATRAMGGEIGSKDPVHPNDHVNMGQSSNDVIPTALHVAAYLQVSEDLLPALKHLQETLEDKTEEYEGVVKTGRTHLMDAMPITLGQEFSGYARQIELGIERIESALPHVAELAIGGTAVGTGLNAHPQFASGVVEVISERTGLPFQEAENHFEAQAAQNASTELSGQLKTVAAAMMKIANDLRWMNSGPNAGLGEIATPAVAPGSSIMPGKINPVIGEAVTLTAAQVIANDVAVTLGDQSGNFELNLMLPLIAHNLLQSIAILANAASTFADKGIDGMSINQERMKAVLDKNPILVTALSPLIGYDKAAKIAKRAFAEGRTVREIALEEEVMPEDELDEVLNARAMTEGGILG